MRAASVRVQMREKRKRERVRGRRERYERERVSSPVTSHTNDVFWGVGVSANEKKRRDSKFTYKENATESHGGSPFFPSFRGDGPWNPWKGSCFVLCVHS